jgi:CMP-N-acetylneuraminic acid synthetase
MAMSKIVAMVPVKLQNERLPGKNIRKFDDGTPLIRFILDTLLKVPELAEIYVYCSDEKIIEYLPKGIVFLKRDKVLDRSETKGSEILEKFLKDIDADIYVLSHATGPFTKPESIGKCIHHVVSGEYDSAFLAKKSTEFLWSNGKPVNYNPHDIPRTQDLHPLFIESSGAYVFPRETFLKYKSRIGINPYICEISTIESIDIDYPEDFDIANAIYMNLLHGECIKNEEC